MLLKIGPGDGTCSVWEINENQLRLLAYDAAKYFLLGKLI
jgi:hypothetical protein